jgi:UDP-2-acetamido-2-deoxy-ribo-hexuluronate aminotransferase
LLIEDQSQKCRLEQELSKNKIAFRNIYKTPISKEQASQNYILNSFDNGVAAKFCDAVLNLPLFPYMTEAELTSIVNVVNK